MTGPRSPLGRRTLDEPKIPAWFKVWFAVCALAGLAFLGLIAWAIIRLVEAVAK